MRYCAHISDLMFSHSLSFDDPYSLTLQRVWSHPSNSVSQRICIYILFSPPFHQIGRVNKWIFSILSGKLNNRLHVVHFSWLRQNGSFMCEWVYWVQSMENKEIKRKESFVDIFEWSFTCSCSILLHILSPISIFLPLSL